MKNDKSVRGNWPPADEVAKECVVDGVCQWRWRSGDEEEVICNGCHDNHMKAPRARKRSRREGSGDGVVSRSYQKRDEKYDGGYYVTQKWVSSSYQADIVLFIIFS